MARALARGWGDPVLCSDHGSGRAKALADELGGQAVDANTTVADRADLVVRCHKPANLRAVAAELDSSAGVPVLIDGRFADAAGFAGPRPGT